MYDADVLIAGGGPAGLAASVCAAKAGLSAIVCEPRPVPVDKACGEGIMPGGLAVLRELGVALEGMALRGIRYTDGKRHAEAVFDNGPGLGVRRTELHAAMSELSQQHGTRWTTTRITEVHQDADGVTAHGMRARYLLAADGLHSPVRRALGITVRPGRPRRFGVRWHFRTPPWSEFVEVWWSRWGEAYVTPVAPDQIGVAILTAHQPDLAWFPGLLERLGEAERGPVRGAGPLRQTVARRVHGRVLLIGDAGGYEDALTGEGISLAVKQAQAAVSAIEKERPADYEREWTRLTRDYRVLTRGLVLSTGPVPMRKAIVPLAATFPGLFARIVNVLAR